MIYFLQDNKKAIKIGYTKDERTFKFRLSNLTLSNSKPLSILNTINGGPHLEKALHKKFSSDRIHGEWFNPTSKLLQFIKEPQCEQLKIESSKEKNNSSKNNNRCKWCNYKWHGFTRFQETCPWCLKTEWKDIDITSIKTKQKIIKKVVIKKKKNQFQHIINKEKFQELLT